MTALEQLLQLAQRLDAADQAAAAARLRGAAMDLGVELVPLFELLTVAAEERQVLAGAGRAAVELLVAALAAQGVDGDAIERLLAQLRAALGDE